MSHLIEIIDGRASIAYNGETPWHGLGVEVDDDMTPGQMLVAANADWSVRKVPCVAQLSAKRSVATGYKALVRDSDNAVLTVTGANWHPIQNSEAFDFFADFVEKGELSMHTAGVLRNGKMVWALAKADKSFSLFRGKDRVETHVLFYNPHDYGKSAGVMVTPTRVVCDNTLAIALGGKKDAFHARITHRKMFNPEEVKAAMRQAGDRIKEYEARARFLAGRLLDEETFKEYCAAVFPTKAKKDGKTGRLADLSAAVLETQPGAELGAGTWWAAFNAITFTTDHLMGQQYTSESTDQGQRDRRLYQTWFGAVQRQKLGALDLAVKYAEKARAA